MSEIPVTTTAPGWQPRTDGEREDRHLSRIARAAAILQRYSKKDLEILTKTVAKGATEHELALFLYLANRYELDPFLKEIWCIKRVKKVRITEQRGGREIERWDYPRLPDGSIDYSGADLVIMVGHEGYLRIAKRHPHFGGIQSHAVYEQDEFEADLTTHEVRHKVKGMFRGKLLGAYARVIHKERGPYLWVASLEELRQEKSEVWETHPAVMAVNRVEAYAIRRQFDLGGLYSAAEFGAEDPEDVPLNDAAVMLEDAGETGVHVQEQEPTRDEFDALFQAAYQYGMSRQEVIAVYERTVGRTITSRRPTRNEFELFKQALNDEIDRRQAAEQQDRADDGVFPSLPAPQQASTGRIQGSLLHDDDDTPF